jgi:hypothetical protein
MAAKKTDSVAYFYNHKKREVLVVLQFNQWAVRNLRAKGILSMEHILTRPITPAEVDDLADCTRLHFYRYTTWPGLLEDERRVAVPDPIISRLKLYSTKHPLEDTK